MKEDNVLMPEGRIVQGHPTTEKTKGYQGKELTTKAGDPRVDFFHAVAIKKDHPRWPEFWSILSNVAQKSFPNGESSWQTFAWKVIDGDQPPHNQKEGFAGCWVVRVSSRFCPSLWKRNDATGKFDQLVDPKSVKCGDYVRDVVSIVGNEDKGKPGLYINPVLVEIIGYGDPINSGPDANEILGAAGAAMIPQGASTTPGPGGPGAGGPGPGTGYTPGPGGPGAGGPSPGPGPGAGGPGPGPGPGPGGPGAGGPSPGPGPGAGVPGGPVPAPDFLQPKRIMTEKAAGFTYEQYIAAGWTDQTLISAAMMYYGN